MDFVDRIDECLKQKNLKRVAMCEDLEITHSALTDWKKRGTIPAGNVCLKIARYLGVPLDWLISGDEFSAPEFSSEERSLVFRWRDLDDQQRHSILLLADAYEAENIGKKEKDSVS